MFNFIKTALLILGDGFFDVGIATMVWLFCIYGIGWCVVKVLKAIWLAVKSVVSWIKYGCKIHMNINFKKLLNRSTEGIGILFLGILSAGLIFGLIWLIGCITSFILNII